MFLVGGLLADRWGARRAILLGCLVRIAGYAALAAASNFSLFLLGAVLTGAGGALFSPALEAQLSQADRVTESSKSGNSESGGKKGRWSVFVWLAVTGEIGAGRRLADAHLHRHCHGHVLRSDRYAVPKARGGLQNRPRRTADISVPCILERWPVTSHCRLRAPGPASIYRNSGSGLTGVT
nr:MFS transporter [Arthrobacter sp. ISL-5]